MLTLSTKSGAYMVVSRQSTTVAHSSMQTEMKSLCGACKEIVADRDLLDTFKCEQKEPTPLYTESQSSIDVIENRYGYHPKCRHFNRDINFVRECVALGLVLPKASDTTAS